MTMSEPDVAMSIVKASMLLPSMALVTLKLLGVPWETWKMAGVPSGSTPEVAYRVLTVVIATPRSTDSQVFAAAAGVANTGPPMATAAAAPVPHLKKLRRSNREAAFVDSCCREASRYERPAVSMISTSLRTGCLRTGCLPLPSLIDGQVLVVADLR